MKIEKLALPVLLALLLAQAGCSGSEKNDIRGNWSFRFGDEEQFALTFQGNSENGTVKETGSEHGGGTYAVSDGEVVFNFLSTLIGGKSCNFRGAFVSEDRINGNMEIVAPYPPFAWTVNVVGIRL